MRLFLSRHFINYKISTKVSYTVAIINAFKYLDHGRAA